MKITWLHGTLLTGLTVSVLLNLFFWFSCPLSQEQANCAAGTGEVQEEIAHQTMLPVRRTSDIAEKLPMIMKSVHYSQWNDAVQIQLSSDRNIQLKHLKSHLSCEPSVPFTVMRHEWEQGAYLVKGNFQSGREYLFTLRKGLRDEGKRELRRNLVFSLRIPDRSPRAKILTGGMYFPWKNPQWVLPVEMMNVKSLRVIVRRYHDSNLNPFGLNDYWEAREYQETVRKKDFVFSALKNKAWNFSLDLKKLIPAGRPGGYFIQLSRLHEKKCSELDSRIVFITDLGISAAMNASQQKIEFYVRHLSDGSGAVGAEVFLYSRQKQLLGTTHTDKDGHGAFSRTVFRAERGDFPRMLLVKTGQDVNILELDRGEHDLALFGNSGKKFAENSPMVFLYTERGIYRKDEKVFFSGCARTGGKDESRILKNAPLELVLRNPFGTLLWERRIQTDEHGVISGDFLLPKGAMAGYYSLSCGLSGNSVGSDRNACSFQVGNFVPDRLNVRIETDKPILSPGERVHWKSSAKYYFGPSVEKASAEFTVHASPAEFPKHWRGFAVGNPEEFRPVVLHKQVRRNYCDGDVFQYGYKENFTFPVLLTGVLSVAEPGGRSVSHSSTVVQLKTEDYLGLKYEPMPEDIRNAVIHCRLLNFEPGKNASLEKQTVKFRLNLLSWRYILKENSGRLQREWIQERIPRPQPENLLLDQKEKCLILKNLAAGFYELEAGTDRHFTVMKFWHDAGEGGVRSRNPNVLVLETDRQQYRPGEKALVSLETPEKGHVMLFCGEKGLDKAKCFAVAAGRNTLSVDIPDHLETDRYFCGVTLVYGKDGRHRMFHLLRLNINQDCRRLLVSLQVPKKNIPGSKVPVTVSLTDWQNRPASGWVQIYAVDEGILSLTDYRLPDPFAFFYRNFYCGTAFYDTYGKFYPEISLRRDGRIGGDRMGLRRARGKGGLDFRHEKSAVVVLKGKYLPSGQQEKFMLSLPEHTGTMRLMAVAMGEDQAGAAEEMLELRHPMTVLGSMPDKLMSGDECELTLQAFNHELSEGFFQLTVELPPGLKTADALENTVKLKRGGEQLSVIRCKAEGPSGNQTVRISLKNGDAVVRQELFVQIRSSVIPVTRGKLMILEPGESYRGLFADKGKMPPVSARLQIMTEPLLGISEALDWLNSYPYGCLEQITAGAFPLLAAEELQQAELITEQEKLNARDKIVMICNELMARKLSTGGFAGWPGGSVAWTEAGIYAAHFLFLADRNGFYRLGAGNKTTIQKELLGIAEAPDTGRFQRAYAIYVLAVSGRDCANSARNILQQNRDWACVPAAGALFESGYAREAAAALQAVLDEKSWLAGELPCSFAGPATRIGMMLAVAGQILPDNPRLLELVRQLQNICKGGNKAWGNTHENAWACYGLMQVPRLRRKMSGQLKTELIFADGKKVNFQKRGMLSMKKRLPELIRNLGTVPVFMQWTETVLPDRSESTVQNRGLKIRRMYLDEQGRSVYRVKHGSSVTACIQMEAVKDISQLALVDLLPGGLVIEDERLAARSAAMPGNIKTEQGQMMPRYMENGEDRLLVFGHLDGGKKTTFTYHLRAVGRGKFHIPACQGEDMYDTGIFGQDGRSGVLEVY